MENNIKTKIFSEKTKCIDLKKLERENQKFLYIGFALGILLIGSVGSFVQFRYRTYTTKVHVIKPERGKIIRVKLITIPRETEKSTAPIIEQEKKETDQIIIDKIDIVKLPITETVDTLDQEISEEKISSILRQPVFPKKFPDFSRGGVFPDYKISIQDTLKPFIDSVLFPERPEPKRKKAIPIEKIKDERRKFRTDILGIQLDGIGAIPVHLGRHALKSFIWKIQDISKKRSIEEARNSNFTIMTEKDMRFMILLWRDGLLNPYKLSRLDRLFIIDVKHNTDEIMTNEMYLFGMEKRGLVSSLVVAGVLVFRANFSRGEVLNAFFSAYKNIDESDKKDTINKYFILIISCYDYSINKIIIPE